MATRRWAVARTAAAYRLFSPLLEPAMELLETGPARQAALWFHEALRDLAGRRVLDLGAGTGRQLRALASDQRRSVVAVDLAPAGLRRLRAWRPGTPAVAADAHRLPFATSSFDAVIAGWVFEVVADPEEVGEEVRRVLRPGAELLLLSCTRVGQPGTRVMGGLMRGFFLGVLGRPIDAHRLCRLPGFELIDWRSFDGGLFTGARLRALT